MQRSIIVFAVVTLWLASILSPAALAAGVNASTLIPSQVTINAVAPTVTFDFYSDSSYTTTTTDFIPQTPTYLKVSVQTLNVIEEVVLNIIMFADTDPNAVGTIPSTTNQSNYVNITVYYDLNADQWQIELNHGNPSITTTTWQAYFDTGKSLPTPGSTSGDFYIVIIPGKTAAEAAASEAYTVYKDWDVIVIAKVSTVQNKAQKYGYTMYFYSELSTDTTSINFGSIDPKSTSAVQNVPITIVANGPYNVIVTATSEWAHTTYSDYVIKLTQIEPPGSGQFLIRADDEVDTNGELVNPVKLTSTIDTSTPIATGNITWADSSVALTVYMQLEAGDGIRSGTYKGAIEIHIVNMG